MMQLLCYYNSHIMFRMHLFLLSHIFFLIESLTGSHIVGIYYMDLVVGKMHIVPLDLVVVVEEVGRGVVVVVVHSIIHLLKYCYVLGLLSFYFLLMGRKTVQLQGPFLLSPILVSFLFAAYRPQVA